MLQTVVHWKMGIAWVVHCDQNDYVSVPSPVRVMLAGIVRNIYVGSTEPNKSLIILVPKGKSPTNYGTKAFGYILYELFVVFED